MKRLRKRLPRLLCAAAAGMSLLLSGCHGAKAKSAFVIPEALEESRPIEISFWAKNDTNKNQTNVYKKAIEDFEALYPNIKVNLKLYTDYGKIYNDVITNIATDTTPNVAITYPDHIASYIQQNGTVVGLDALMADEKYGLGGSALKFDGATADEMVDSFVQEGVIDGTQYAMPFMRSTEALYINKTLVEKLGYSVPDVVTWDWIWEVSNKAVEQKNPDGTYALNSQKTLIPFIYKSTDNMMIQMLKQQDAGYSTEQGEIEIFNDTTREDLKKIAQETRDGAFSTFKVSGYPANLLNASQTLFAVDSTAGSTWMGAEAPLSDISPDAFTEFETVVRPVPQMSENQSLMISQGPSMAVFGKEDPQEVLASWLFVQYMLSNEPQIGYAKTEGYLPVTHKALEDPAYLDYLAKAGTDNEEHYAIKIEAAKLLMDHLDDTFTTPVFNGSASLRNAAGELIEDVVRSTRRKQTVDDAYIDELYEKVSSLYRLDQISSGSGTIHDLGPMPASSVWFLSLLALTWVILGAVWLFQKRRKAKNA